MSSLIVFYGKTPPLKKTGVYTVKRFGLFPPLPLIVSLLSTSYLLVAKRIMSLKLSDFTK